MINLKKKLSTWPSINIVKDFAPSDFKRQLSSTRVIIDENEIPIIQPSNKNTQRQTWSNLEIGILLKF